MSLAHEPPTSPSKSAASTREAIIAAADTLFYEQGFERTSFAHIAQRVALSRGNFYYHFKTKDEILHAVIARRAATTAAMLAGWSAHADTPEGRLACFAQMLIDHQDQIKRFGCPVGTLCAELAKQAHPAQGKAGMIFDQFRAWLRDQFVDLGRDGDADTLAMHLLARSQGVAALAQAFHDEGFIRHEVALMADWVGSLQPSVPKRTGRRTWQHPA